MSKIQIECVLIRTPPTEVQIGAAIYQFKSNAAGRHVCDVEDEDAIEAFLAVPEAYRIYRGEKAAVLTAAPPEFVTVTPVAQDVMEPPQLIMPPDPVAADIAPPAEVIVHGTLPAASITAASAEDLAAMPLGPLRALFRTEVGREPSPRSKAETLAAQIIARREENTQAG